MTSPLVQSRATTRAPLLDDPRERLLSRLLNVDVEREDDVRTGDGIDARGVAEHVSMRIDENRLLAANPGEHALVAQLDTGLPDDVSGAILGKAVLAVLACLELLLGDRANISNDVRGKRAVRIRALGSLLNAHPGKDVRVLPDEGHDAPRHVD